MGKVTVFLLLLALQVLSVNGLRCFRCSGERCHENIYATECPNARHCKKFVMYDNDRAMQVNRDCEYPQQQNMNNFQQNQNTYYQPEVCNSYGNQRTCNYYCSTDSCNEASSINLNTFFMLGVASSLFFLAKTL